MAEHSGGSEHGGSGHSDTFLAAVLGGLILAAVALGFVMLKGDHWHSWRDAHMTELDVSH
jgi:hypothetical protein